MSDYEDLLEHSVKLEKKIEDLKTGNLILKEENKRLVLLTESVERARKRHGILNKF